MVLIAENFKGPWIVMHQLIKVILIVLFFDKFVQCKKYQNRLQYAQEKSARTQGFGVNNVTSRTDTISERFSSFLKQRQSNSDLKITI